MGSDAAMANASAVARDAGGKKKRINRTAKLKQCKLDARREQWLSQVKNKGCAVGSKHSSPPSMSPSALTLPRVSKPGGALGGSNPEARSRREGSDGSTGLHDSDLDSPTNSPTSNVSANHSSRQHFPSSSISSGSYSRSVSDADECDEDVEVEGGGLDDWEAVADALTTNAGDKSPSISHHNVSAPVLTGSVESRNDDGILKRPEPDRRTTRAWRPDDVFRPQSLPNLSKQRSFPMEYGRATVGWSSHHGLISQPSSCPICYEDLDLTDSSFRPCSCGFLLCLFCHKRILEADGRCPGCRKQYGPVGGKEMCMGGGVPLLPLRLSRSFRLSLKS